MKKKYRSKRSIHNMIAGLLVMLLCVAAPQTALAGTGGLPGAPQTAQFKKTLQYADSVGLTTPTATFTFNFVPTSLDGNSTPAIQAAMPTINPQTLNFSSASPTTINGSMVQVNQTSSDVLAGINFTSAGIYKYTVSEATSGFTAGPGETINYSLATYILTVVVAYDAATNSCYVQQTLIEQTTGNNGGGGAGKGETDPTDPGFTFSFTNTYSKRGGTTPGSDALTITKTVAGDGSNPVKQFTYTMTASDVVTGVAAATYTGIITRVGGSTVPVSLVGDGTVVTFTLADGERIVFNDLPAGTTFSVEETGTSGYIPTYTGTVATGTINGSALVGANLSTGTQTIGSTNNVVNFTNTIDSSLIPAGGILSNMAPFLALAAVTVLAFVAFAAINRRKANR